MLTQPRMRTGCQNEAVSSLAVFHITRAGGMAAVSVLSGSLCGRAEAGACRLSVMVIAAASQGLPG